MSRENRIEARSSVSSRDISRSIEIKEKDRRSWRVHDHDLNGMAFHESEVIERFRILKSNFRIVVQNDLRQLKKI